MATHPTNMRFLNPSTLPTPATGYSHMVEITRGRSIFIVGQVALDRAGQVIGLDFTQFTTLLFVIALLFACPCLQKENYPAKMLK